MLFVVRRKTRQLIAVPLYFQKSVRHALINTTLLTGHASLYRLERGHECHWKTSIKLDSMFLRLLATFVALSQCQNGMEGSSVQSKWSDWSRWSDCSRTCGIGVSSRTRQCLSSHERNNKTKLNCTSGAFKEHRACNAQRCPMGSVEFRVVQCQQHNNQSVSVSRSKYDWEPFYRGLNKCALLCRPKGSRFYLQLSSQVIDGTRCDPNDPYHICVAGRCEVVGCDGVLGSKLKFDKCGVCGGNDSTCHIISGIFTQTVLPPGYNRVTSIPKGACNINITELSPSLNRLAVKVSNGSYVINGNWMIGPSKDSEAAGTVFTYYHPSPTEILESMVEYIIAPGPINTSIDIMVIHEHTNRGIMYTYTIPSHKTHPSLAHKHHLRHHGHRHQTPPITAPISMATGPPAADSGVGHDGREIQSDQVPSGVYSQSHQRQQPAVQAYPKSDLPRIYRPPSSGGYQYPSYRNIPSNQAPGFSNGSSGIGHIPNSGLRPSIYRGPQVPPPGATNYTVNRQSDGTRYSDRGHFPGAADRPAHSGRPLPGVHYRGPVAGSRPVQPGINYGIQGPLVPPAGYGQQRYGIPDQAGLGYGQPGPPGIYRQPVWYPGQQVGYQPPVNPYQPPPVNLYQPASYPSYQPRPYQVHPPAPAVRQPYYPHGTAALELPSLDASSYGGSYDYYHSRVPSPLNDQRVLQSAGGGQPAFSGSADFAWKISGFSECSKTCGGGVQNTLVVCMKVTGLQVIVTEENCDVSLKPKVQSVACNNSPCPPGWEASNWTACSTTCDRGQQTRIVECKRRIGATHSVGISATHCLHEPRPESVRVCNEDRPCVRWKIGEWNQCSTECGRGQRSREVVCVNYEDKPIAENKCNGTKPKSTEICDMGSCAKTWFYTEWSDQCSIGCGDGVQSRQVHCSAEPDRCSEINRPKSEKPCKNEVPCGGQWFTGPWSECMVTCGEGVAKRDVICMKKLGHILAIVGDENCEEEEKPEVEEPCEREPCRPEWFMTDWSECSRSCDTGLRLREVKCLDADEEPSQSCDQDEKPETRQTCNTHKCLTRNGHNDTQSLVVSCEDKFKNCRVVVQARLCRYPYYKDVCCFSCISHDHDEEHT